MIRRRVLCALVEALRVAPGTTCGWIDFQVLISMWMMPLSSPVEAKARFVRVYSSRG